MKRAFLLCAAVVAGVLVAGLPGADAVDLGGTWEGQVSCKGLLNGEPHKFTCCNTIEIDQDGSQVKIEVSGIRYVGIVTENVGNPDKGALTFIRCGTDATLSERSEMVFATVKTSTDDGKGTLKGSGPLFVDDAAQWICSWSYKRIAVDFPGVTGCP